MPNELFRRLFCRHFASSLVASAMMKVLNQIKWKFVGIFNHNFWKLSIGKCKFIDLFNWKESFYELESLRN